MRTELIFVRHGTTVSNENGLLHGRTDVPLGPAGLSEARRAALRIKEIGDVDQVVSSPLERAVVTAREIGHAIGVTPTIEPQLSEFDFGDLEGLPFDDLPVHHPELYLSMIDPDGFDQPFPNGESRSALHDRVVDAVTRISSNGHRGRAVVVAHLVVIATAIAHLTTGDPNDVMRYLVRNGSISHLTLNGTGTAEVIALDDVGHLE